MDSDKLNGSYTKPVQSITPTLVLSPQSRIIYDYIKSRKGAWVPQKDIIDFRGNDERRTRILLKKMETEGILESRMTDLKINVQYYNVRIWNIKHK